MTIAVSMSPVSTFGTDKLNRYSIELRFRKQWRLAPWRNLARLPYFSGFILDGLGAIEPGSPTGLKGAPQMYLNACFVKVFV